MSGGDLPEALYLPEAVLRPAGRESRAARCVARSRLDPEQFGKVFSDYFAEIHGYVARRLGSVAPAGPSLAEVSFALDIPYGTAGSRLSRARRTIRRQAGRPDHDRIDSAGA